MVDGRNRSARFQTTRWSLVLAAGGANADPGARAALQELCAAYWYPLYVFVRRQGQPHEEALDLTQSFFLALLQRDDLRRLRPEAGRFRAFLLASMKNFLGHEWRRERTIKRGGARTIVSLDADEAAARFATDRHDAASPEKIFDRQWARTVIGRSTARLEREFRDAGKSEQFRLLHGIVSGEREDVSYRDVASHLGVTEAAVKMAVKRLRERLGRILREEVAETVGGLAAVDEEVRYLLSILGDD